MWTSCKLLTELMCIKTLQQPRGQTMIISMSCISCLLSVLTAPGKYANHVCKILTHRVRRHLTPITTMNSNWTTAVNHSPISAPKVTSSSGGFEKTSETLAQRVNKRRNLIPICVWHNGKIIQNNYEMPSLVIFTSRTL